MNLTLSELIAWLIVGALAGNLVGRVVTLKKEGLGRWTNLGLGMGGALLGGLVFNLFHIDLGLGEIKITLEGLISAFLGAIVLLFVWRVVRWFRARKKKPQQIDQ